jgi:hypothetical protein
VDSRLHEVLERLPGRRGRVGKLRLLATQIRGAGGGPGRLVDAAAEAAELEPHERYRLLAETDVLRRIELILGILDARTRGGESLPERADARWN